MEVQKLLKQFEKANSLEVQRLFANANSLEVQRQFATANSLELPRHSVTANNTELPRHSVTANNTELQRKLENIKRRYRAVFGHNIPGRATGGSKKLKKTIGKDGKTYYFKNGKRVKNPYKKRSKKK